MMEFNEYKNINAINASSIKAGRKSMMHMHASFNRANDKDSAARRWGRLAHMAI